MRRVLIIAAVACGGLMALFWAWVTFHPLVEEYACTARTKEFITRDGRTYRYHIESCLERNRLTDQFRGRTRVEVNP